MSLKARLARLEKSPALQPRRALPLVWLAGNGGATWREAAPRLGFDPNTLPLVIVHPYSGVQHEVTDAEYHLALEGRLQFPTE